MKVTPIQKDNNKLSNSHSDTSTTTPPLTSDETFSVTQLTLKTTQNTLAEEGANSERWLNHILEVHSLTEKASTMATVSEETLKIVHNNLKLACNAMRKAGTIIHSQGYIKFLMNALNVYGRASKKLKKQAGPQFFTRVIDYIIRLQLPSYTNEEVKEVYNLINAQLGDTLANLLRRGDEPSEQGTVLTLFFATKFGHAWTGRGMTIPTEGTEPAFSAFYKPPPHNNPCRNHKGAYADGASCNANTAEYVTSTCCQWASESAFCIQCKRNTPECPECKNAEKDRWGPDYMRNAEKGTSIYQSGNTTKYREKLAGLYVVDMVPLQGSPRKRTKAQCSPDQSRKLLAHNTAKRRLYGGQESGTTNGSESDSSDESTRLSSAVTLAIVNKIYQANQDNMQDIVSDDASDKVSDERVQIIC